MRTYALTGICAMILIGSAAACKRSSTYSTKDGSMTVEQKGKDVSSLTFTGKDGQKVTMDVGGGKVPADYPKDLPVYENAKVIMVQSANEKNMRTMVLESQDEVGKIVDFYKQGLESNGWKMEGTMSMGEVNMFTGVKDKRQAVIQIVSSPEKRTINQVLSDK
ncbi:MAG TPA: hypothetical protein VL285_11615 [Bryobacteraceae bacterium]|nr:hypothetical protein [Bryobacteraceae bacterium]